MNFGTVYGAAIFYQVKRGEAAGEGDCADWFLLPECWSQALDDTFLLDFLLQVLCWYLKWNETHHLLERPGRP